MHRDNPTPDTRGTQQTELKNQISFLKNMLSERLSLENQINLYKDGIIEVLKK